VTFFRRVTKNNHIYREDILNGDASDTFSELICMGNKKINNKGNGKRILRNEYHHYI